MSVTIPESHKWLLEDVVVATLGTLMPDGPPQVHKIWFDYDGETIRVNTAEGRQKDINMRERPYATVLLVDPEDPYFYVELRGRAERVLGDEAEEHVDLLAQRYMGQETFPWREPGQVRVMYKIKPTNVVTYGEHE